MTDPTDVLIAAPSIWAGLATKMVAQKFVGMVWSSETRLV